MKKYEKIELVAEQISSAKGGKIAAELLADTARYLKEYAKSLRKGEEAKKLSKVNTKWSEKEDEKLRKEYEKGWTIARMAKAHSRSLSGIVSRLVKLSLIEDEGENGKKRWTEAEDAALLSEAESKKTLERMSELHGRSMSGILSRLEKLGYDIDSRK